jgi:hypothetical protein
MSDLSCWAWGRQECSWLKGACSGVDPHQDNFTVGIVDIHGVEITRESFPATACGYLAAVDLLTTHGVERVGILGSASWGAHAAISFVAAGFDAREVPAQRPVQQRRSRRLDKTDPSTPSLPPGRC